MKDTDYNQLMDEVMMSIEDAIDASDVDIDYENAGGVLTLRYKDTPPVIISRQTHLKQLWVAAKSGGFHFEYNEKKGQWFCNTTRESLPDLLNRCLCEQSGENILLNFQSDFQGSGIENIPTSFLKK